MIRRRTTAAFGACIAAMAACAAPPPAPPVGPQERQPSAAEIEEIFWARADSARQRFTDADVAFVTGMIGHHAQALVMARLVPSRAADPAIRILAARIINAQNDEIALMRQWLLDRGQPVPEIRISGIDLRITGVDHRMDMPGMLGPAQLQALDAASGPEFDRLFLTYMVQHHEGAVTMVLDLFATDGAGQDEAVFKLASDIQVDQITEIARMEQMLQQRNP